jgi:hypothetical protein
LVRKNRSIFLTEVTGGWKLHRKVAYDCVRHSFNELMPRIRKIDIRVQLKKNLHWNTGLYGLMDMEDDRTFRLEVDYSDMDEMISTIMHEMVHVKQYLRKELVQLDEVYLWKNVAFGKYAVDYRHRPWEFEAYNIEEELVKSFKERYI